MKPWGVMGVVLIACCVLLPHSVVFAAVPGVGGVPALAKAPVLRADDPMCTPSNCGGHNYRGETRFCREACGGGSYQKFVFSIYATYDEGYWYTGGDACQGCGPCEEGVCYHWEDEQ